MTRDGARLRGSSRPAAHTGLRLTAPPLTNGAPVRTRRVALTLTPLLSTALLLTGCGGGDKKEPADSAPQSAGTTSAAPQPQFWPLTGLQASGSITKDHPAIVVKMDNTTSSAPQLGLSKADLVTEELVEGGMTRLAAFYYSQIPGIVGPVRSMRASDIGIVTPAKADVVTSGAAPITISRIQKAGITFFGEGSKGFFRDNTRRAPYNLFTDLKKTVTLTRKNASVPGDYLDWGTESDFPGGQAATSIDVPFSAGHTTRWSYDGQGYVNTNSNAKEGDRFKPDSILVLRVRIGDAGYKDPAGNFVPETKLTGTGKAFLFHGGKLVRGTWSKKSLSDPVQLATAAGPLKVPAGHTWIELVPVDAPPLGLK